MTQAASSTEDAAFLFVTGHRAPGDASCADPHGPDLIGLSAPDDRVGQRADPVDRDLDPIPGLERELVGRDDPRAGEEDHAVGEVVVPAQPVDQLLEGPDHPRGGRTPLGRPAGPSRSISRWISDLGRPAASTRPA